MREILFRGKTLISNEWVYGYFVKGGTRNCIVEHLANFPKYDIDINTLGQYTGLTDKNGKKIFEGDMLKDDWGKIFEVIFTTSSCGFMVECISAPSEFETGRYRIGDVWCNTISVIGNIYDNPELLKGDNVEV